MSGMRSRLTELLTRHWGGVSDTSMLTVAVKCILCVTFLFRKDWGALILVDERFGLGMKYTKGIFLHYITFPCDLCGNSGLSKWVKERLVHEKRFCEALRSLTCFTQHMKQKSIEDASSVK